jgi:GNAT superfamily N-acetyltransferase
MELLDLSNSDLPGKIQENLIAYMRIFANLPGMAMEDSLTPDDETFWFISRRGAPGDNILKARWNSENIDQKIDRLFEKVGQHVQEIEWMVFPSDRPRDLSDRLSARGLPASRAGNWLWINLESTALSSETIPGFHIEKVVDDRGMAEWVRTSEAGFGGDLACFNDAYARHGYGPTAFSIHTIGYLGDQPVTSGTLLDAGGTAAVYDLSTLPEYRRQGFGGAMTGYFLRETKLRGYSQAWIWSSNIGKSVYQKLGFIEADFGIRAHLWKKNE